MVKRLVDAISKPSKRHKREAGSDLQTGLSSVACPVLCAGYWLRPPSLSYRDRFTRLVRGRSRGNQLARSWRCQQLGYSLKYRHHLAKNLAHSGKCAGIFIWLAMRLANTSTPAKNKSHQKKIIQYRRTGKSMNEFIREKDEG